jgi:hypothetical protein
MYETEVLFAPMFLPQPLKQAVHKLGNVSHKEFVGNAMDTSSTVKFYKLEKSE